MTVSEFKVYNKPFEVEAVPENSMLMSDCYKFSHRVLYPEGTDYVYSTYTPRANSYFPWNDKMVSFGYEMFVQRYLVEHFNEHFFNLPLTTVIKSYQHVVASALGEENADATHIKALHKLGYLPVWIKALPEGIQVPMKVPVVTVENTNSDFYWLTNFLETLLLSETFVTAVVASMAREFQALCIHYADKTADSRGHVPYQCHDFSERGQHGNGASLLSGVAHLTSFVGSDTIQASVMANNYYGADLKCQNVLKSVLASEHSVMQSYGTDEENTYATLAKLFPNGILSLVSDTYDYFNILTVVLPKLKDAIMARDGKVVIRPDSGDPATIIAGLPTISLEGESSPSRILGLVESKLHPELGKNNEFLVYADNGITKVRVFMHSNGDISITKILEDYVPTPEDIGSLDLLFDTFGGTVNDKGYKVLDSHIGLLYGEGITLDVAHLIFDRMEAKGFSSENIVFGVGAFVYSVSVSRDSFNLAFKSQLVRINGEEKQIFKDPKTDEGHVKRSLKGKVVVVADDDGEIVAYDGFSKDYHKEGDLLQTIFKDGERTRFTPFEVIRNRIANSI